MKLYDYYSSVSNTSIYFVKCEISHNIYTHTHTDFHKIDFFEGLKINIARCLMFSYTSTKLYLPEPKPNLI